MWLEVDPQLGKYLRKLYFLAQYGVSKLGKPSWDDHITVVSSHERTPLFEKFWWLHEGREVKFNLFFEPATNDNAYWYPITSEGLNEIRRELGLGERMIPLHLAAGYLFPGKVIDGCQET